LLARTRMDMFYNPSEIATRFMYKVYGWMSLGLALTGITAYAISNTALAPLIMQNMGLLLVLFLIQLGLVVSLSFFLSRLSYTTAALAFLLYSVLTGVTFSTLFLVFTQSSLALTFGITAAMFASLALYGYYTQADLTSWGNILFMALIGLIIGLFVNLFLHSSAFQYLLSAVGVIIFSLLTAYDAQQIKLMCARMLQEGHMSAKVGILGALTLYLDFINLFLMLLNFTGQRKD
jgi:uncharacterized protein